MINKHLYNRIVANCNDIAYYIEQPSSRQLLAIGTIIEYEFDILKFKNGSKERYDMLTFIRDECVDGHIHLDISKDNKRSYFYDDFCIDNIMLPEKITYGYDKNINIKIQKVYNVVLALIISENKFTEKQSMLLADYRNSFKDCYSKLLSIATNINNFTTRIKDKHEISDKYFDLSNINYDWVNIGKELNIKLYTPLGNAFNDRKILIQNENKIFKFSRNNKIINELILVD